MMSTLISPAELARRCAQPTTPLLLDVRTPGEFSKMHISGSTLVPLDTFKATEFVAENGEDYDCVVICQGGRRAEMAADKLTRAGMKNIQVLEGGVNAWKEAGLPLLCGRGVISIERQVRIAVGILILTGMTLGTWVNPAFYGVAAFIGAGLIFAGITDICTLALLLAKMPWNRASNDACLKNCAPR